MVSFLMVSFMIRGFFFVFFFGFRIVWLIVGSSDVGFFLGLILNW